MDILSGSELFYILVSVFVLIPIALLLPFMVDVPDGGKMGKVRAIFMLSYGALSFAYLVFFIGFATSPQHSFASHLADMSVAEAFLLGYSILGVVYGAGELFRKPDKKSEVSDNASEYPPHAG